jgi:hypothetical protein
MGGAFLRIVAESSREGGAIRRSGEFLPCCVPPPICDREGILEGLFWAGAVVEAADIKMLEPDETELDMVCLDTLAPKFDTGVFERAGGAPPRMVPARLGAEDLEIVPDLLGMPVFEGVFARGGATAAFAAEAYNSSRYRLP